MHFSSSFWSAITHLTAYLTLSPLYQDANQQPLLGGHLAAPDKDPLIFKPHGGRGDWAGSDFECNYTLMHGYEYCGDDPKDVGCWLRPKEGFRLPRFDINTDYEKFAPNGTVRKFSFDVTDGTWNTDGMTSYNMQLVNKKYPGPWIQACWGDTIIVNVTNHLEYNGTAIHWHGVTQNHAMPMDGVPGITQCPIAPDDYFVYNFTTRQYGSSWYHSHYSVQYANGMLGPLTIHGPMTGAYDEAKFPLMMSDWFHNSAFRVIHDGTVAAATILLNGTGDVTKFGQPNAYKNDTLIPPKYTLHFERSSPKKRYMMRIINTSFSTAFVFSIDHHLLEIISADFVPVIPKGNLTHIHVNIGQRYNIIVTADPKVYDNGESPPESGDFWIRTSISECFEGESNPVKGLAGYDTNGILRYNRDSTSEPNTTAWPAIRTPQQCKDETGLVPQISWKIGDPANNVTKIGEGFVATYDLDGASEQFPLRQWVFQTNKALQIDYSRPIFLELENDTQSYPASWAVVPENYTENDWIFLHLTGEGLGHPIHLHGHDFAIVAEFPSGTPLDKIQIKRENATRRDVVLLKDDDVIIAFKPDNPGSWIMHCHIAFHASKGLAMQILERQEAAVALYPPNSPHVIEAQRVCRNWDTFRNNCTKHYPGYVNELGCYPQCGETSWNHCNTTQKVQVFMDDSGI